MWVALATSFSFTIIGYFVNGYIDGFLILALFITFSISLYGALFIYWILEILKPRKKSEKVSYGNHRRDNNSSIKK